MSHPRVASVWNPGAVPVPPPPPPPVPSLNVFSLLQFDSFPVVDSVVVNTAFPLNLTAANIVSSPTAGTSIGAFVSGNFGTLYGAGTNVPFPYADHPVSGSAVTMEGYIRRDGPIGLDGGFGWNTLMRMNFESVSFVNYLTVEVVFYNTPNSPRNGNTGIFVRVFSDGVNGGTPFEADVGPVVLASSTYEHAAAVFENLTLRIYLVGTKIYELNFTGSGFPPGLFFTSSFIQISSEFTVPNEAAKPKYFDSFRVTDGALYTANFTPPVAPLTLT